MPYAVRTAGSVELGGARGLLVSPIFGYGGIHVIRTVRRPKKRFYRL